MLRQQSERIARSFHNSPEQGGDHVDEDPLVRLLAGVCREGKFERIIFNFPFAVATVHQSHGRDVPGDEVAQGIPVDRNDPTFAEVNQDSVQLGRQRTLVLGRILGGLLELRWLSQNAVRRYDREIFPNLSGIWPLVRFGRWLVWLESWVARSKSRGRGWAREGC
jgi:hypothetical protein